LKLLYGILDSAEKQLTVNKTCVRFNWVGVYQD